MTENASPLLAAAMTLPSGWEPLMRSNRVGMPLLPKY